MKHKIEVEFWYKYNLRKIPNMEYKINSLTKKKFVKIKILSLKFLRSTIDQNFFENFPASIWTVHRVKCYKFSQYFSHIFFYTIYQSCMTISKPKCILVHDWKLSLAVVRGTPHITYFISGPDISLWWSTLLTTREFLQLLF